MRYAWSNEGHFRAAAGFRGRIYPTGSGWLLSISGIDAGCFSLLRDARAEGQRLLEVMDGGMAAGYEAAGQSAAHCAAAPSRCPEQLGIERQIWQLGFEMAQGLSIARTRELAAKPAHESFARGEDGSRTCEDCGQRFEAPRADGAVMRSHRRRIHGEAHYTPGVCNA